MTINGLRGVNLLCGRFIRQICCVEHWHFFRKFVCSHQTCFLLRRGRGRNQWWKTFRWWVHSVMEMPFDTVLVFIYVCCKQIEDHVTEVLNTSRNMFAFTCAGLFGFFINLQKNIYIKVTRISKTMLWV